MRLAEYYQYYRAVKYGEFVSTVLTHRLKRFWIIFPYRGMTAYEWQLGRLWGQVVHLYGGGWQHWWQPNRWSINWQSKEDGEDMPKLREFFWPGPDETFSPDLFSAVVCLLALLVTCSFSYAVGMALRDGLVPWDLIGVSACCFLITWFLWRLLWGPSDWSSHDR